MHSKKRNLEFESNVEYFIIKDWEAKEGWLQDREDYGDKELFPCVISTEWNNAENVVTTKLGWLKTQEPSTTLDSGRK